MYGYFYDQERVLSPQGSQPMQLTHRAQVYLILEFATYGELYKVLKK